MGQQQEIVRKAFVRLEQNGKVFLVQEKGNSWGLWSLPGGHVEPGETLKQAVIREAKEESGYAITVTEKIGDVLVEGHTHKGHPDDVSRQIHIHVFLGEVRGKQGNIVEDFLDTRWVLKSEVANLPLRGEWVTMGLEHV